MHTRLFIGLAIAVVALGGAGFVVQQRVGSPSKDGGTIVPTAQTVRPAGDVVTFPGRPVDVALSPDGRWLYLKDNRGLVRVDTGTWRVVQQSAFLKEGGGSLHGIITSRDGKRVYASGAGSTVWEATVGDDGQLTIARGLALPGPNGKGASYPCGLAFSPDEKTLYICLSRNNSVAQLDIASGKVEREIPVGVAPFDIAVSEDGAGLWVSNWGGRRPKTGERTAPSAETETLVDERGVANSGTVGFVSLSENKMTAEIATGLHASDLQLTRGGKTLFVANANNDTVSVIDTVTRRVRESVEVKPEKTLPFGSMPNSLTLSPDEKTLYVACAGNNAVAVVSVTGKARVVGFLPAGWYPGAVIADKKRIYIANVKGNGSRLKAEDNKNANWGVYNFAGTVQRVTPPDAATLRRYTAQVLTDSRVPDILRQRERERTNRKAVPLPERMGEASVFKHVIYIIKENRTYDQVLGDLPQANGSKDLAIFGRDVTPNHHALAESFVLLDNFYCNGVLSADGHSWATEGNVTDHLEKAFGGFTRSYTFGDDPLTYSSSGFLWDNALGRGLSFRNWGEMDYTDEKPNVSFGEIYTDWKEKTGKISFTHKIGVERLRRYSSPDAPGWNMDIPDVLRADIFIRDLKKFEESGDLPNLCILYLPNDHTSGTTPGDPTPRAYMADNDLALGQVVEAVSKSKFWSSTCIFVVEDDPQAGFDHVDGHRSPCLVISPYTRRGVVVSDFYNQTSVLHTMERILGLPPMNQMDAMAPLMTACFTNKANLRPYTALPNKIPLTEINPKPQALSAKMRYWAQKSAALNFEEVDQIDEDTLNRVLWHAQKGADMPYPAHLAGPRNGKTDEEDE